MGGKAGPDHNHQHVMVITFSLEEPFLEVQLITTPELSSLADVHKDVGELEEHLTLTF